ncbi:MAG: HlyC/CorC family transporter [Flavobacteriales bacterium]|nr:HlyC/CorC family transporter [Flavobacteriales bacterium]
MYLTLALITIVLSAFFSGIEIAFVSSNKLQLELDKGSENTSSKVIAFFSKNESNFITTMLIGNNISLVVYGIVMTKILSPYLDSFELNSYLLLFVQTVISTSIILVTAEFLPKSIFKIYPNTTLRFFSFPIFCFFILFSPFACLFIQVSKLIVKLFFGQTLTENKQFFNKTDLDDYLDHINSNNTQDSASVEVEMLQNTLDLSEKKVRECMIPRTEIIAMNINSTINDLKDKFIETKLSKILIYKNNIDSIIGYVHSSDLFRNPRNIRSLLLPLPFVPETMSAMQLLSDFIDENKGVALVVDEFGGTSGMLTIEDVTEEIVGEIDDEYDTNIKLVDKINDGEYSILARLDVISINKDFDLNLPESDEYETIAGLVLHYLENIPSVGDVIDLEDYKITINEVDDRSVIKVHLLVKS